MTSVLRDKDKRRRSRIWRRGCERTTSFVDDFHLQVGQHVARAARRGVLVEIHNCMVHAECKALVTLRQHEHRNTPPHTTPHRVGALTSCHPGHDVTPVGPGKDTHGTLGPLRRKAVGGSTALHSTKVQKSNKLYKGLQHGSGASHDQRQPLPQVTRRATIQEPITDHAGTCTTCVASREEHRI